MSTAQTRQLVERYFAALNASDLDAMENLLHEDVAHDINQKGRQIGPDAVRRHHAMMARHFDETLRDIEIMVSEGGVRAAAEYTVHGRYIATAEGLPEAVGQAYAHPAGTFFEIDDGRITRVTDYANLTDRIARMAR